MPLNCFIHLSLFVRSPSGIPGVPAGQEPALWLCVQPCVAQSDLPAWMEAMRSDTATRSVVYQVLDKDVECVAELVPVLLPPDLSIRVTRKRATVSDDLYNDRTGPRIVDAGRFMRDNVRPEKQMPTDVSATVDQGTTGAYARSVMAQTLATWDASAAELPEARLRDMGGWLALSFWFGATRIIRPSTVDSTDKVGLFDAVRRSAEGDSLPSLDARRVSHLSMCGHMLRIDQGLSFADLAQLQGLDLTLERVGAPSIQLALSADESTFLSDFFKSIDPVAPVVSAATLLQPRIVPDIAQRVYVTHQRTRLLPSKVSLGSGVADAHWLFGTGAASLRQQADTSQPEDTRQQSSELEGIAVFYKPANKQDNFASKRHDDGVFLFHETLRCRLQPYRDAPPDVGGRLWQLVPVTQDRGPFISRFGPLAGNSGAAWPAGVTLHTPNGSRLSVDGHFLDAAYVGTFLFPWDDTDNLSASLGTDPAVSLPTVLFHAVALDPTSIAGKSSRVVDVNLVVRLSDGTANRQVAAIFRPDAIGPDGPRGPLWEGAPNSLAPFAFTAVEFVHRELTDDLVKKLGVTFTRAHDYRFEHAQSAQHLESVLQVVHPTMNPSCTDNPAPVEATLLAELKRECTGYRSVRASLQVGPPGAAPVTRALHPWSSKPSLCHDTHDGYDRHAFVIRERMDIYSPSASESSNPGYSPGQFYTAAYVEIGVPRRILFDLEHPCGHAIAVASDAAPALHDVAPQLPTGLRGKEEGDSAFVTVSLSGSRATLRFDLRFLERNTWKAIAGGSNNDKAFAGWNLCWRAVAELAHADAIGLRGVFRTFDFAGSLDAAQRGVANPDSLLHSLVPVADLEGLAKPWPVPDELRAAASDWLAGRTAGPTAFDVDVPTEIAGKCEVLEFWLEVNRAASDVAAPENPQFAVLRTATGAIDTPAFDAHGEIIDPLNSAIQAEVQQAFGRHMQDVAGTFRPDSHNAWRAIAPSPDAQASARNLRELLQSQRGDQDDDTLADLRAKDWIVPRKIVAETSQVRATVVPLGFRPLAGRYAGSFGANAIVRYLSALDVLINVVPGAWSADKKSASDWQTWFNHVQATRDEVVTIIKAVANLLQPVFDPVTIAPTLDPQVQAFLRQYKNGSGGFQGLAVDLLKTLLASPRLFSETRAFLVTRLSADQRLPRSLHAVNAERTLQHLSAAGGKQPLQIEHAHLAMKDVVLGDAGPKALVFVEALPSRKYTGTFSLDLQAFSVQDYVVPAATRVASLSVEGPHVGYTSDPPPPIPIVDLPSREPIVQPAHVWTAVVPDMNVTNWALRYRHAGNASGLSLRALVNDLQIRTAVGGEPALFLRAASDDFGRSGRKDRQVAAAVFNVYSDEADEFVNDSFQLFRGPASAPVAAPAAGSPPAPPPNVPGIFKKLDGAIALDALPELPAVLDADAVKALLAALGEAPSRAAGSRLADAAGFEIEIDEPPTPTLPKIVNVPSDVGIFLFRTADPTKGAARHVLVVTGEANVWKPFSWSLIQTRNLRIHDHKLAPDQQPGFNPALSMASSIVGDSAGLQVRLAVPFGKSTKPTSQRSYTAHELVNVLLVGSGAIDPDADKSTWLSKDLSVLVSAVQKVTIPALGSEYGGKSIEMSHGSFPLTQLLMPAGDVGGTTAVSLDKRRSEFIVDFTWTGPTNAEIFRIQGVPLTIND